MRSTTRLLLAVAAISAVSIPVAHAQFGFGGTSGTSTSSGGLPGLNGGGTSSGGLPGFNGFSNGLPGLDTLSRDNNDTTTTTAPAPGPAPAPQATTTDWVCPDGFTFQLDDDGNWVRDDAGVPQCVEATGISILDDF